MCTAEVPWYPQITRVIIQSADKNKKPLTIKEEQSFATQESNNKLKTPLCCD